MSRGVATILIAFLLGACQGREVPAAATPSLVVDADRISVSGISSGAMMATQMHVAHSDMIGGVAMIAGGPYYCAEGNISKALGPCMQGGAMALPQLVAATRQLASDGSIDSPANLSSDKVWLFHGQKDIAVHLDGTQAARNFYSEFDASVVDVIENIPAAHGFPTLERGSACDAMEAPYLLDCDYDAAGEILAAMYGELAPRGTANGQLRQIAQPGAADATMLANAFLYVPQQCADGESCGLHVVFHGCQQSSAFVGDVFVTGAGYNEWADSNRLMVLYPQVDSSRIAPLNPLGCWDWWGYSGSDYAGRSGAQISVVKATIDSLVSATP